MQRNIRLIPMNVHVVYIIVHRCLWFPNKDLWVEYLLIKWISALPECKRTGNRSGSHITQTDLQVLAFQMKNIGKYFPVSLKRSQHPQFKQSFAIMMHPVIFFEATDVSTSSIHLKRTYFSACIILSTQQCGYQFFCSQRPFLSLIP